MKKGQVKKRKGKAYHRAQALLSYHRHSKEINDKKRREYMEKRVLTG